MKGWDGGEVPGPVFNDLLYKMVVHLLCLVNVLSIHFVDVIWFLSLCENVHSLDFGIRSKVSIMNMMEVNMIYNSEFIKHG